MNIIKEKDLTKYWMFGLKNKVVIENRIISLSKILDMKKFYKTKNMPYITEDMLYTTVYHG